MTSIDAARIDALLPQTQCRRCGFADCRAYAEAIAAGTAKINRCPPGGERVIHELAALLEREVLPLDPSCGIEMPPRIAVINADECTGCARCLPACPVDAIIGARRQLHTVVAEWCTGCELCVAACPMDCIPMIERPIGAAASPPPVPAMNRDRYADHQRRLPSSLP
jgi:electron transport complex protein RnfB